MVHRGITPNQWAAQNACEFDLPTIGVLNNTIVMRSEWDRPLEDGDQWVFISQPAWANLAWYWIVAIIGASVAIALLLMPSFKTPDVDDQDSLQSLTGQRNRNRAGEPIECAYGRTRVYPSIAARSWNRFIDNDQWRYSMYSLGHGLFDIEQVLIEDSPIDTFQDVEYKIYQPGEVVDMFPDTVVQPEVSDVELFGPTHPDYPSDVDGWFGPIIVNPPSVQIERIEVDVVYPRGLFLMEQNGNRKSRVSHLQFEYHRIDDAGNLVGSWASLTNWTINRADNEPQRITAGKNVTLGRYQIRARRVTPWVDDSKANDQANWVAIRGFAPSTKVYDVTVMAMAARASNNLNDRAAQRVNLWATRKLPVYRNGSWTAPEVTRNPIWAFCDLWKSKYGAYLADKYLDLPSLVDRATQCESSQQWFDYIFDQKVTVWEASRQILSSFRGLPVLRGGRISLVVEEPKTAPVMVFNDNNISKDSFQINADIVKLNEEDGLEVEYFDSASYLPETILCTIGADLGDVPRKDRIIGVTDRNRAYREGLYRRAKAKYQRVGVSFDTGASALFLTVGDMISVAKEFTRWGRGGFVLNAISLSGDVSELFLSEDVEVGGNTRFLITQRDGSASQPSDTNVFQGSQPNSIYVRGLNLSLFDFSGDRDMPQFILGDSNSFTKDLIVTRMVPKGRDMVGIEAVFYDERIFEFDGATAPVKQGDRVPDAPERAPRISSRPSITMLPNTNEQVLVSWVAPLGAVMYLVERSNDGGTTWGGRTPSSLPYIVLPVSPFELLRIRVAAVGFGTGPWSTSDVFVVGTSFDTGLEDGSGNLLEDDNGNVLSTFGPNRPALGSVIEIDGVIGDINDAINKIRNEIAVIRERLIIP